jgi:hypothetical protein
VGSQFKKRWCLYIEYIYIYILRFVGKMLYIPTMLIFL